MAAATHDVNMADVLSLVRRVNRKLTAEQEAALRLLRHPRPGEGDYIRLIRTSLLLPRPWESVT